MTAILQKKYYTVEEYLELEALAEERSEYYYGEIFAMAGGSPQHSEVCAKATTAFSNALRGRPCKVYNSDLQVELSTNGHYKYPDMTIVCGQREFSEKNKNALTNPMLIVEVLSDGTAEYDKNGKFFFYRQMPSFREYVLIDQNKAIVTVYTKQSNQQWQFKEYIGIESIAHFETIDVQIPLAELYEGVDVVGTLEAITELFLRH
ncbi:MAG: hypothetical protein RLZZ292_2759 [Bacteroidota bacterium]|jgi:Uma2 family endonuclease